MGVRTGALKNTLTAKFRLPCRPGSPVPGRAAARVICGPNLTRPRDAPLPVRLPARETRGRVPTRTWGPNANVGSQRERGVPSRTREIARVGRRLKEECSGALAGECEGPFETEISLRFIGEGGKRRCRA